MADILISAFALGPLSIEVRDAAGRRIDRAATLSSSRTETTIRNVEPGEYTVIATRPSGEQLVEQVDVKAGRTRAVLHAEGPSPHEFMTEATDLGLLRTSFPTTVLREGEQRPAAFIAGQAGQNLFALQAASSVARTSIGLGPIQAGADASLSTRSTSLTIVHWMHGENGWERHQPINQALNEGRQFLQLRFDGQPEVRAVGLLDEGGYGPIVVVPPFLAGVDVTFLAEGVGMSTDGARVENPSAVRTPVALSVPRDPVLADLLVALNAPAMQQADALWNDASSATGATPDYALDLLLEKRRDPAAAALGALFLARFDPKRVPFAWLRNLSNWFPHIADGAMLLAWFSMTRNEDPSLRQADIRDLVRQARKRPCLLFARTRSMLVQAARLHGPYTRTRKVDITSPRHPRPGDFLDFAADAGGLESFWGSSPVRPGRTALETRSRNWESKVMLIDGEFRY